MFEKAYEIYQSSTDDVKPLIDMGMNENSAKMTLTWYGKIFNGELYKRSASFTQIEFILNRLFQDNERERLAIVLESLKKYVEYYKPKKIGHIVKTFEKKLDDMNKYISPVIKKQKFKPAAPPLPNTDSIARDIQNIIELTNIANTEKSNLIQSRVGQGKFRENLVTLWNGCAVTGCQQISLLIASHIKPWSKSNNQERLDPYNGLLLLPNLDKVFDLGLISFDASGNILISNKLRECKTLGISKEMSIEIKDQNKNYLEYHRSYVFKMT
jgi:predicted restriction endonuclease